MTARRIVFAILGGLLGVGVTIAAFSIGGAVGIAYFKRKLLEEVDLAELVKLGPSQRRARLESLVADLLSREGPVLASSARSVRSALCASSSEAFRAGSGSGTATAGATAAGNRLADRLTVGATGSRARNSQAAMSSRSASIAPNSKAAHHRAESATGSIAHG